MCDSNLSHLYAYLRDYATKLLFLNCLCIGDLETEAAPPKKSGGFSDAAGKMGGFGVAGGGQMAMITKSLVKVCTICLLSRDRDD